MWYERITQHLLALVVLVTILLLNGCAAVAPGAAPAGQQAAPAGGGQAARPQSAPPAERGAAAPTADEAAAPAAPASGGAAAPAAHDRSVGYAPVTAGVTDDNIEWNAYSDYLNRHWGDYYVNPRDVSERYILHVIDEKRLAVHDATVEIYSGDELIFAGRTDAGGRLLFHPRALDRSYALDRANDFRVVAQKGYTAQSQTFARYSSDQWEITINDPLRSGRTQLDLLFLIDATGSMGDEIDKLKASMADVADQLARLPEQPDIRYGLVAYRDRGDAFVVRPYDFTYDLNQFQNTLAGVYADGGGDTPEALNEALHRSLNDLSWRAEDTVRLILLVADAPPHLDYAERFSYDTDMIEAVRRGIKIFPIGASNLEADGEYIFRQLAQFTGGKFVFLTYKEGNDPSSGPGTETDHEVENYSVDTLDRLVVRLVKEELAKLSSMVAAVQAVAQVSPTPTPLPASEPISCTIDLTTGRSDCGYIRALTVLEQAYYNQILVQVNLDAARSGYAKARFDVTYNDVPSGISVNIGDSISNDGYAGDNGDQANDAEVQIANGTLAVYGNDYMNRRDALDGDRQLFDLPDAVRRNETISLEVSDGRVGINYAGGIEVVTSPTLFALNGQPDREGRVNGDIYAAFNRGIAGARSGSGFRSGGGVSKVVVTLYPAR